MLEHLEKKEVSPEDKKMLYHILMNRKYETDLQRQRFIECFNLTTEGQEFKNYLDYSFYLHLSYNAITQQVRELRAKITREKNLEDLTKIQEINIRSRKDVKDTPLNKRGDADA